MAVGELSQGRVAPEVLPIIAEFGDVNTALPDQLRNGRDQALESIRRYVPEFSYDEPKASQAGRDIDAWAERNQAELAQVLAAPVAELPERLRLSMGSDRAQSFILATFTEAALGLGPWLSGEIGRRVAAGDSRVTDRWAREDAADRLEAFALIVKLDRDGSLATIFVPPAGTAGFGLPAIPLWFILVVLVIVAASLVVLVLGWRRIELNNRLMRELCQQAYKEGNDDVVKVCVEATRDLQTNSPAGGITDKLIAKAGLALFATGVVYAGFTYGLPAIVKAFKERSG